MIRLVVSTWTTSAFLYSLRRERRELQDKYTECMWGPLFLCNQRRLVRTDKYIAKSGSTEFEAFYQTNGAQLSFIMLVYFLMIYYAVSDKL